MAKESLGRGLESLFGQAQPAKNKSKKLKDREDKLKNKQESVFSVEIDKISPNPHQPRRSFSEKSLQELSDSIREHGILQPLIVTKVEKPTERGHDVGYELISGERRLRAAKLAGMPRAPVIIRDSSEHQKVEMALVENLQRENLNPVDLALGFKQLQIDFGLTHKEIGNKVGKNRVTITNAIRLLALPKQIQESLSSGEISEGHARAILLAKPEARMRLFKDIIKNKLDVRQAEQRAKKLAEKENPFARGKGPKNPFFKKLEKDLEQVIGRKISITQRKDLGHLKIEFNNKKDLSELVKNLKKIS